MRDKQHGGEFQAEESDLHVDAPSREVSVCLWNKQTTVTGDGSLVRTERGSQPPLLDLSSAAPDTLYAVQT